VNVFGTQGRIALEIPFNAPQDGPTRLWHQRDGEIVERVFDRVDQYTLQGDALSRAILDDGPVPTPLEDAVANMRVIEAVFGSGKSDGWVEVTTA
jgi:predicted dehydrogenase